MSLSAFLIIVYIQTFLSAIIAVAYWVFPKQKKIVTKLVGLLFMISFLCNIVSFILRNLGYGHLINLPGSLYDLAHVSIVLIIYNHIFERKYERVIYFVLGMFVVGALLNLMFFQKLTITSYTKFAGSFIIVPIIIYYFYKLLVDLPTVHIHRLITFWTSCAFLIYNAGALFLYAFTDYLITVLDDNLILYWSFHNFLFILQDILILAGLAAKGDRLRTAL